MDYIMVGIGGALGSIFRFLIGRFFSPRTIEKFPPGTFIVNITGAFLLGLVSGLGNGRGFSLFLALGFLGSYTTYSTFMMEGINLLKGRKILKSIAYLLFTLIAGLLLFACGIKLANI